MTQGRDDPGDTKIILVCRFRKAHDGGVGGDKSISRGTESQVFRGRAAGKRLRTRSRRDKANKIPQPRCFFVQRGSRQFASVRFSRIDATQKMAITRGRGGACGVESRKFDCGSLGSSGDDRRRWQIIYRNPGPTPPTRWQWEVCRLIVEKGEGSTVESFLACRVPPAGRSNRVTPGNPPVRGRGNPCRCNETDGNWRAVPNADHPLGSTQSVTKTDLRGLGTARQSATPPQQPLRGQSLPVSQPQQDCLCIPVSVGWSLRSLRWNCHLLVKMTEFAAAPRCSRFVRGVKGTAFPVAISIEHSAISGNIPR